MNLEEAFRTGDWLTPGPDGVPGDLLMRVLLGEPDVTTGRVPALRLRDARITGRLDLAYGTVVAPMEFENCDFDEPPDLTGAETRSVRFAACRLPGLRARLVRVEGDLEVRGTTLTAQLMVEDGTINGSVLMEAATLAVDPALDERFAFAAGGLTIEASLFGRGVRSTGEFRMIGARVDGGVFLSTAHLVQTHPDRAALCLDAAQVAAVNLTGVRVEGEVQLRNARIEGEVSFEDATLGGSPVSVRARGMQAGELRLNPAEAAGTVDLSRGHVGAIRDAPTEAPSRIRLDGLTYDHLLALTPDDGSELGKIRVRMRWLALDVDGYRPQPYEELAAYYRRLGHDDDARRLLLAKQRRRRSTLPRWQRIGGYVVDGLVGYGYRPWLAALWSLLLIGAGWAVFAGHPPQALEPEVAPRFSALVYAVDLLVPIGAFGQRTAYDPVGWTSWVADLLIASGWVLATALIAGVTRNVGKD